MGSMNKLRKLYNSKRATCCVCGCGIESALPLGSIFVLSRKGDFYCSNCDSIFEDGDEDIFDDFEDEWDDEDEGEI